MVTPQDTKTWPLSETIENFLDEPAIATLTTFRPDGSPHVVPVSFSWDAETRLVRIMVGAESKKAKNLIAAPGSRAAVCQAQGGGWVTLEGTATVTTEAERVAEGRKRYINRYRRPRPETGDGNGNGAPRRGPFGGGRPGGPGGGPGGGPFAGGGPGAGQRRRTDPLDSWQAVIEIAVDRVMSRNV